MPPSPLPCKRSGFLPNDFSRAGRSFREDTSICLCCGWASHGWTKTAAASAMSARFVEHSRRQRGRIASGYRRRGAPARRRSRPRSSLRPTLPCSSAGSLFACSSPPLRAGSARLHVSGERPRSESGRCRPFSRLSFRLAVFVSVTQEKRQTPSENQRALPRLFTLERCPCWKAHPSAGR